MVPVASLALMHPNFMNIDEGAEKTGRVARTCEEAILGADFSGEPRASSRQFP